MLCYHSEIESIHGISLMNIFRFVFTFFKIITLVFEVYTLCTKYLLF